MEEYIMEKTTEQLIKEAEERGKRKAALDIFSTYAKWCCNTYCFREMKALAKEYGVYHESKMDS
jgi:hypothetical protein